MNFIKKYILTIIAVSTATVGVSAQTLDGAYFLDGSSHRHQLNPALIPSRGYVDIPILGGLNFSVATDLTYSDFIYPSEGDKLQTFLSDEVSPEEFDKNINDRNTLNFNFDMSIIAFGFHKWNGFNTFELSLHSNTSTSLPGDLFRFLKNGSNGLSTKYDLKNIELSNKEYAEIALGHAHRINEQWTVGAKIKGLLGLADAKAHFEKLSLTMSDEQWHMQSRGVVDLSCGGIVLEHNEDGEIDGIDFETSGLGPAGGGAGIDLGVTYSPIKNLVLSLAVTDLGFLVWNKNLRAETPDGEILYDGFENIGGDSYIDDNGEEVDPFDEEVDQLTDELEALFVLNEVEANKKRKSWLTPKLSVGAEYQVLNNKISFGVLSTTRFYANNTHTSLMGSVNLKPLTWIQLGVNGTVSNISNSFGAILIFGPLFVGAEITSLRVTPEYIPLGNQLTANINFGLSIPLGKDPKLKKKKVYNEVPVQ